MRWCSLERDFEFPASNLWIDFGFCWVTLSGARSWIPSPCNLWVAAWAVLSDVFLERVSIPSLQFVARTLILLSKLIFGAVLNSYLSIFVAITFGFGGFCFLRRVSIPWRPILEVALWFCWFWSDFELQLLQFGVHILVLLGEYSLERFSFELQILICLSSCSCFVSGSRMVGECYCTQKRDFQLMGEVGMRARRSWHLRFLWFKFLCGSWSMLLKCSGNPVCRHIDPFLYGIPHLQMVECPWEKIPHTEIWDRVLEQLPECYRVFSLQYGEGRFLRRTESVGGWNVIRLRQI
jgi:hypothetical protein